MAAPEKGSHLFLRVINNNYRIASDCNSIMCIFAPSFAILNAGVT